MRVSESLLESEQQNSYLLLLRVVGAQSDQKEIIAGEPNSWFSVRKRTVEHAEKISWSVKDAIACSDANCVSQLLEISLADLNPSLKPG